MTRSKTAVIVNPHAGNGSAGAEWPSLRVLAENRLGPFQTYITNGPGDATNFTTTAVSGGARHIICVGGDGTLNEVVNGFMQYEASLRSKLVLGFIPNGTGCDFVKTVAIPRDIRQAVDAIARHHVRTIDLGRLNFKDHGGNPRSRYFSNITSFGLGGEVSSAVNRTRKPFGPFFAFMWATLISIFRYGKKRIRLRVDDGPENEFMVWNVAVANGRYHGGGMQVAPKASVDDGRFHVTVIADLSLAEVFLHLPKLYNGKIGDIEKVVMFEGTRIEGDSHQRVLLEVDGEQPGVLPVVVEIIPGALNIITEQ